MDRKAAQVQPSAQDQLVPVRVVILYENLETGKHARRTYDYLVESLNGVCEFQVQLWKFNLLNDSHLRLLATQDAAEAEIVMVSAQGEIELPLEVQTWFDLWLGARDHPIALVGLFSHPERAAPVRDYLEAVARNKGVEFFAQLGSSSSQFQLSPFAFLTPG